MDVITAIKPLKDAHRCSVRVGRKTVGVVHEEQVESLGLAVGRVWDAELAARVSEAAGLEAARRDAVRILRRRAVSRSDLAARLRKKGHAAAAVETAVQRMVDKGLVNDESYGRLVIEAQRHRKPAGPRLLKQKLRQKGLASGLVERLVGEAAREIDAVGEARALAEKKLATAGFRKLDALSRKRRMFALLGRRGYEMETIHAALSQVRGLREGLGVEF